MTIHRSAMTALATRPAHELTFTDYTFEAYGFRTRRHHIEYGDDSVVFVDIGQPPRQPKPHDLDLMGHKKTRLRSSLETVNITWRSMDGAKHKTRIDLAQIFKDRRIHHNVRPDDVWHGERIRPPTIILIVDDRDVRLYMKAMIPLRERSDPKNPYTTYRREATKVASLTF
ncbi:MAG: hypothetical protein GAK28_04630 [Luteibacter sp.]|uniref:hypothetical protein n=1 Tax=Luteibacter sp. TaxID=1886636 RepID=UPI0013838EC5|nr:hypothetical protein [Luteibacter sp.]KAF1003494.1 MAG: hypothetical protein GAK28_04630 [Luteibacter sp.]